MATDRIQLRNLRNAETFSGSSADINVAKHFDGVTSPKLPASDELEFGEIALNIAPGYETLATKSYNGEIVYIPFNVSERLIEQSNGLKEKIDETTDDLKLLISLSGKTVDNQIKAICRSLGLDEGYSFVPLHGELSGKTMTEAIDSIYDFIEGVSASAVSVSQIDEVLNEISHVQDDLENRLLVIDLKVGGVSADTKAAINDIISSINALSGIEKSDFAILSGMISSFSGESKSEMGEICDSINNLSAATDNKVSYLIQFITNSNIGLKESVLAESSAYTDSKVSGVVDSINESLSAISGYSGVLSASIDSRFDALQEEIEETKEEVKELSGVTLNRYNLIEGALEVAYQTINNNKNELDDKINLLSGSTDDKIEQLQNETSDAILTTANQLSGSLISYIDSENKALSGSLQTNISNLKLETNVRIDNLKLSDLKDVSLGEKSLSGVPITVLTKSDEGWGATTITNASDTNFGFVKIGSGLTENNGVISTIPLVIDNEVLSGSTNPVTGGAVYDVISNIEGQVGQIEKEYGGLSGICSGLSDSFAELSANTEITLNNFSGSINTFITEVNSDIEDYDLVWAAAITKQNESLGFDINAKFNPTSTNLQGKNVTEAIDYTYNHIQNDINNVVSSGVTNVYDAVTRDIQALKTDVYNQLSAETSVLSGQVQNLTDILGSESSSILERAITYKKLVELKENSQLRQGILYRLTNYQATVKSGTSARTRKSVITSNDTSNNDFDIIIRATSDHTLDENVTFVKSNGKPYFEDCAVSSWKGKYCIDNDTSRFDWAVSNGYGVIYYMKDEYNNEAPYDFKNIMFYGSIDSVTAKRFTFSNPSNSNADMSMYGSVTNNVIKPTYNGSNIQTLNEIVFVSEYVNNNEFAGGCKKIKMVGNFDDNKISKSKSNSTITTTSYKLIGYTID